jgi:hypothetical protein
VAQFNPVESSVKSSVADRSIQSVTHSICDTLFTAFDTEMSLSESLERFRNLMDYLDWSEWKRCGECPYNKVCFIPVWPLGAAEDRENPQCRNATELEGRMGYWGNPRGPFTHFEALLV